MIKVLINRSKDGQMHAFHISGHADYSEPGSDIVCAGVSAVTQGMVNAVEKVLGVKLNVLDIQSGLLHVQVPSGLSQEKSEQLQLLLESMLVMLQSIKQSYGKYMVIHDKKVRR